MTDARPGAAGSAPPPTADATRSRSLVAFEGIGLGVVYAIVVVALLLLARVGKGFIYQGF